MTTTAPHPTISVPTRLRSAVGTRIGRVITGLVGVFLLFDAVTHILNIAPVVEGSRTLGFDVDVMPWVGALWTGLWLRDTRVRDLMTAR